MGWREIKSVLIETVQAPQIALIGKVQEHQIQDTRGVEGIHVTLVEPELDFLHGFN